MRFSSLATVLAGIATTAPETITAFTPPTAKKPFQTASITPLSANKDDNFGDPEFGDSIGNHDPDAQKAFRAISANDPKSLLNILKDGLNPDTRYFNNMTLLHFVVMASKNEDFNIDGYSLVIDQLRKSGADLMAKNKQGYTALDYAEIYEKKHGINEVLPLIEDAIDMQSSGVPLNQKELNSELSRYALTDPKNINTKRKIVELIKTGADVNTLMDDDCEILDTIKSNWSEENAKTFEKLLDAKILKSAQNGKEKDITNQPINDTWVNASIAFYKSSFPRSPFDRFIQDSL